MRIVHLSDTHGKHHLLRDLPKADMVIHSGDMSENGTDNEVLDFLTWFCDLDYQYTTFVNASLIMKRKVENKPVLLEI
jgi:3',5'-cyclic AMP phosphodiesterase CpdA